MYYIDLTFGIFLNLLTKIYQNNYMTSYVHITTYITAITFIKSIINNFCLNTTNYYRTTIF